MADPESSPTARDRILRVAGGLALIGVGCAGYALSRAFDPYNRAALLELIAILMGGTLVGQGLHRHRGASPTLAAEEPEEAAEVPVALGETLSAAQKASCTFLGWMIPGLGHWVIGRRKKALLYFTVITATFLTGVLFAQGRNLSFSRDAIYFLAYGFNAGETLLGWLFTHSLVLDHEVRFLNVGFLYASVASLLNIVALMDLVELFSRPRQESA